MVTRPIKIVLPRTQSIERVVIKETVSVPVPTQDPLAVRDTDGNVVPIWKPHVFTYDSSGNLSTDTVTDGANVWRRTYGWTNGAQTSDSGWVKQNG